ncbi:MAG: acyltransferase [Lachnospiraceae bacterium]|nr:acyltransferase [Lachnospiraceae bacterium]
MKKSRIYRYDLIRFLAMLSILVFHFNMSLQAIGVSYGHYRVYAGKNLTLGQQGVSLFFILSGCMAALSWNRMEQKTGESGLSVKRILAYYGKRIKAILPLFWAAYLAAYIMLMVPAGQLFIKKFILTLTGFDGYFAVAGIETSYLVGEWYVGAILLLYLAFPFVFYLIKKYPVITACVLIAWYIVFTIFYPFNRPKDTDALLRILDFSFGIYFALYIKKVNWIHALISAIVFVLCIIRPWPVDVMFIIILQGASSFVLLSWIGNQLEKIDFAPQKAIQSAVTFVAKYSYCIFLIHHVFTAWIIGPYTGKVINTPEYLKIMAITFGIIFISAIIIQNGTDTLVNNITSYFDGKKKVNKKSDSKAKA